MNSVRKFPHLFGDFAGIWTNAYFKRRLIRHFSLSCKNYSSDENSATVLQGWVQGIRQQKYVSFLHINDGSSFKPTQIVVDPEISLKGVAYGCSIQAEGEFVASPGRNQDKEFVAKKINVLGECDALEYPLKVKQKDNFDQIRKFLHLRPRTQSMSSMLRIRNAASMAVHKYFQENGYCFVHTPILTSNDCEGAGETFTVEPLKSDDRLEDAVSVNKGGNSHFFSSPAHLTVSGQLHLEAITGAFTKAYNFSPTFRADKSNTRHHLSEFYMIEAELAFTRTLEDIMQVMEELVKFTTNHILQTAEEDIHYFLSSTALKEHKQQILSMVEKDFVRLTYTDAIKLLDKKFPSEVSWGEDLGKKYEKYIVQYCGNIPVFVTDFPATLKPFYCRENEDGDTSASVDLLVPGVGELCGGTLREERYDVLKNKLQMTGLEEQLSWYLDLRKFGTVPHGGFGMGFDRYLQYVLGVQNIKDVSAFPRWPQSCKL